MGAPIYQMGNMGSSVNSEKKENKSGTIENEMSKTETSNKVSAAEKKRLNTKTKDTEAKTVKQGRLSRKEAVKTAKNEAKSKRDAKLDKPNMVDYTCLCEPCYNKINKQLEVE